MLAARRLPYRAPLARAALPPAPRALRAFLRYACFTLPAARQHRYCDAIAARLRLAAAPALLPRNGRGRRCVACGRRDIASFWHCSLPHRLGLNTLLPAICILHYMQLTPSHLTPSPPFPFHLSVVRLLPGAFNACISPRAGLLCAGRGATLPHGCPRFPAAAAAVRRFVARFRWRSTILGW
jgi:hypothetical protein